MYELFLSLKHSSALRTIFLMTQTLSQLAAKASERPLSPHLQIWKWSTNMALSILHRATGIANTVGLLLLIWMLVAAAMGKECYDYFYSFVTSVFGQILLFGWTGSTIFHMLTGIRHLIMDSGKILTIESTERAGFIILILSVTLTLVCWGCIKIFY